MEIKSYKHILSVALFSLATIALYVWFVNSEHFVAFKAWSLAHKPLFFLSLIFIKISGIVWPPINGGLLTLGSIPVVGWLPAYLTDLVGSIIGTSIAYAIAYRWGEVILHKIFDEVTVKRILSVKIKPNKELEAMFVFRLFGGTVVEAIAYGAGVLKVRYHNFLIGNTISHVLVGVPLYYLTSSLFGGRNFVINLIFMACLVSVFLFAKDRYFSFGDL